MTFHRAVRFAVNLSNSCLFALSATLAVAAESGLAPLITTSTDGKTYNAKFAAGLSRDAGQSYVSTAITGENVLVRGTIAPDPAHIGMKGDLYIVERINNVFYMKTSTGTYVPWQYPRILDLVPAYEDVTLTASHTVEVYNGVINVAGDHRVFLGYQPEQGAGLIYTPMPMGYVVEQPADPLTIYASSINQIVVSRCTLCHVRGGVADRRTGLLFNRDESLVRDNFDIFENFVDGRANGYDYVLSKVSGGDRHVGGVQLAKGSADYNKMASFLAALDGRAPASTTNTSASAAFFNGVVLQSNLKTLRRAAIMLAGRAPTAAEQAAVASGNDEALRTVLRNIMQGDNFHAFLTDAANDRLLTRGILEFSPLGSCASCFPAYFDKAFELETASMQTGKESIFLAYNLMLSKGIREMPLELVARVVEEDLPYSEILTARYTMVNPSLNFVMGGNATFNTSDPMEFQPAQVSGYYREDASFVPERVPFYSYHRVLNRGNLRTDLPHVGLLTDLAFLARYPSTATNRNRARARWTFYHFLGVDIEQSAQRTTDAVALADTANPTMNNPNCTVCHSIMDPVAGAFQDFGDNGFYKQSYGGQDSLDVNYKFPPANGPTPYVPGDTWYRDMRAPGFNHVPAEGPDTLRWLAEQIIADERFASAAVRFWWPAIIGRELLKRPEVASDVDYAARLNAFEAQEASIEALADKFTQSGLNAKTLLIDLIMSEWFRAESIDPSKATPLQIQAHSIAGLGNQKLLTPEQLARKTYALTGFNWSSLTDFNYGVPKTTSGLARFGQFYGGIDSQAVVTRARDMTPLMSSVALTVAFESACPIVAGEFILDDARRKLFGGINEFVTPLMEAQTLEAVTSTSRTDQKTFTLTGNLQAGANQVAITYTNEYCDWDAVARKCNADRNLFVTDIALRRPDGSTVTIPGSQMTLSSTQCGGFAEANSRMLWSECTAYYSFNAEQDGPYTVTARLSAEQAGTEPAKALIALERTQGSTHLTAGERAIRAKLVELHQILLGQTLASDSLEITAAYDLLVDTWIDRQVGGATKHINRWDEGFECAWSRDVGFLDYLGFPGKSTVIQSNAAGWQWAELDYSRINDWMYQRGKDVVHMKQSWHVVMAYLLSHYNYLYE